MPHQNESTKIIKACVASHNYFQQTDTVRYTFAGFIDCKYLTGNVKKGPWREDINNSNLQNTGTAESRKPETSLADTGEAVAQYFLLKEGFFSKSDILHLKNKKWIIQ